MSRHMMPFPTPYDHNNSGFFDSSLFPDASPAIHQQHDMAPRLNSPCLLPPSPLWSHDLMGRDLFSTNNTTTNNNNGMFSSLRMHMNKMMDSVEQMMSGDRGFIGGRLSQPNIDPMMNNIDPMMRSINHPNAVTHAHSTSQMMSYSNIGGKQRLVQSHDEKETGPDGVMRTKKAHRDTDKGIETMQEGLFIGDRGEVRERFRDPQTGRLEDRMYHQNIPAEHRQQFVHEWNTRAKEAQRKLAGGVNGASGRHIPIDYVHVPQF